MIVLSTGKPARDACEMRERTTTAVKRLADAVSQESPRGGLGPEDGPP